MKKRTLLALVLLCLAAFFLFYDFDNNKEPEYLNSEGVVFGTTYHITYSVTDNRNLDNVIRRALAVVDQSLSMFNPSSTISRFNQGEDIQRADDPVFMHVVEKGLEVSRATNGAFDMTVAPLVDLWGFGLKNRTAVTPGQVDSALQYVGYSRLTIADNTLQATAPGIRLDAGAIAKGFACDMVLDSLKANGSENICVEIGGEVAVCGHNAKGNIWRIGVNKPVDDSLSVVNQVHKVFELDNKGMATSGNYRNYYERDGRKYSHTINPLTGHPVQHTLLSATIVADNCMTADAYATACMVMASTPHAH